VQIIKGRHQISAGVWFQRVQDNEDTASRQLGQASFASLTDLSARHGDIVSSGAGPERAGLAQLFGAAYFEDAIKLRPNLTFQVGLRYEFTTGWNEESGRASNYITDSNGILITTPHVGSSVFTQNNAATCWAPARAWPGMFLETGKRRFAPATALLFSDRRFELPAQLDSLRTMVPFQKQDRCPRWFRLLPACLPRPALSTLRRVCSPTPRPRPSRNGIFALSSN
jgi:hypothetical protein